MATVLQELHRTTKALEKVRLYGGGAHELLPLRGDQAGIQFQETSPRLQEQRRQRLQGTSPRADDLTYHSLRIPSETMLLSRHVRPKRSAQLMLIDIHILHHVGAYACSGIAVAVEVTRPVRR